MPKLLDLLKFYEKSELRQRPFFTPELKLNRKERGSAALDGYPPDGATIESISEYRLASLMQYPHY